MSYQEMAYFPWQAELQEVRLKEELSLVMNRIEVKRKEMESKAASQVGIHSGLQWMLSIFVSSKMMELKDISNLTFLWKKSERKIRVCKVGIKKQKQKKTGIIRDSSYVI